MSTERTTPAQGIPGEAASHAPGDLRERLDRAVAAAFAARADIAIVASITVLAAVLRLWDLGTVPLGLHGDEAWTGLDARRILHEGWIGPYVGSALGQPTGPLYFTALLFKFMPETTFTTRFSIALFGVATVPLMYLAFSSMFNRTAGAFSALLLTVMMWHLHLSRTAFMVTSWPFIEVAVLWTLWLALRRRSPWLFAAAGALHGLGVYTYNAYLLFVPVPFVALAWSFFYMRGREERLRFLRGCGLFAATGLLVAFPLVRYIDAHSDEYRQHQKVVNLTDSQKWTDASVAGKAGLVWKRAKEWERGLVRGGRPDYGDGLATQGHPPVDPIVFLLALAGLGAAVWNWRKPQYAAVLATVVLLPLGALLTVGDGLFRRTLGLAPFVALLAALPLAWLWQRIWAGRLPERWLYVGALLAIVAYIGARTTAQYFGPVQDTFAMKYVYPYQLDEASRYVARLPAGTYVYFYSDRWSFNYETRRFLAPDATGEDRSKPFRVLPPDRKDDPIDYGARVDVPVVFVFLEPYLRDLETVAARYPGGTVTETRRGQEVLFRAYYLPRTATGGTP